MRVTGRLDTECDGRLTSDIHIKGICIRNWDRSRDILDRREMERKVRVDFREGTGHIISVYQEKRSHERKRTLSEEEEGNVRP